MTDDPVRSVAIAGGGVAAWLSAAALAQALAPLNLDITVVELGDQPNDPLALASLPPLRALNRSLGLDDGQLVAEADATFRLGSRYRHDQGHFTLGFGGPAGALEAVPVHQHWLRLRQASTELSDFLPAAVAADQGRAAPAANWPRELGWLAAGLHLDTARYTALLRTVALAKGVKVRTGSLAGTDRAGDQLNSVGLDDGQRVTADLWIDATGANGHLIGGEWQDWLDHLPATLTVSIPTDRAGPPDAMMTARAIENGWLLTIPLASRDVHVLTVADGDATTAERQLRAQLSQATGAAVMRTLRPGRRERIVRGNVLAVGEAALGLGSLEGTQLHLIQSAIARLITHFPKRGGGPEARHLDRLLRSEADRALDFHTLLSLAVHPQARPTEELARKTALFEARGRISLLDDESFFEPAWAAALIGLGYRPRGADALAETVPLARAETELTKIAHAVRAAAMRLPSHTTALDQAVAAWRTRLASKGTAHAR